MNAAERIGIPALLIAALYGAFNTAIQCTEMLNERRDSALNIGRNAADLVSPEHADTMLRNDYIPMWIGLLVFIGSCAAIVYFLPRFVSHDTAVLKEVNWLRWVCVLLPAIGFVLYLVSGISDIREMMKDISSRTSAGG